MSWWSLWAHLEDDTMGTRNLGGPSYNARRLGPTTTYLEPWFLHWAKMTTVWFISSVLKWHECCHFYAMCEYFHLCSIFNISIILTRCCCRLPLLFTFDFQGHILISGAFTNGFTNDSAMIHQGFHHVLHVMDAHDVGWMPCLWENDG